jgi:myosin heavy subunit
MWGNSSSRLSDHDSYSELHTSLVTTGGAIEDEYLSLSKRENKLLSRTKKLQSAIREYKRRQIQLNEYEKNVAALRKQIDVEKNNHTIQQAETDLNLRRETGKIGSKLEALSEKYRLILEKLTRSAETKKKLTSKLGNLKRNEDSFLEKSDILDERIDSIKETSNDYQDTMHLRSKILNHRKKMADLERSVADTKYRISRMKETYLKRHEEKLILNQRIAELRRTAPQDSLAARLENRIEVERKKHKNFENERSATEAERIEVETRCRFKSEKLQVLLQNHVETETQKTRMVDKIAKNQELLKSFSVSLINVREKTRNAHREGNRKRLEYCQTSVRQEIGIVLENTAVMRKTQKMIHNRLKKLKLKIEKEAETYQRLNSMSLSLVDCSEVNSPMFDRLLEELRTLYLHIYTALACSESLENHKFVNYGSCYTTTEKRSDLESKLKESLKENDRLKRNIKNRRKLIKSRAQNEKTDRETQNLIQTTVIQPVGRTNIEIAEQISDKRGKVRRMREILEIRKRRLNAVIDYLTDSDLYLYNGCKHFCNKIGKMEVKCMTETDWNRFIWKLRKETEVWRSSVFPPLVLLGAWNNQMEHFLDEFR